MVGDSITLGGSAPAGSQMVDLLRSGDTPLAFEALQAGFSGSSMDTDWSVNSGNPRRNCIYGTCYQTVLEPLYPYTLVHVLLGTNDAIGYYQPGPSDVPTTEAEYKAALENFNLSLGQGLSKVAGKVFRIGHLGDFNDLMLMGTLSGVEMGLGLAGVPHQRGGVDAAMRYLGETAPTAP